MELTNDFVVERDIEETWRILTDLEFIAPCMPGAQLTEVEGEEYRGLVKIKVGPITAKYKGRAWFVEQDAVAKQAKLQAEGRDPRQGNANATVTANMEEAGAGATRVTIHTDLGLTGKIASFGRGAIEDVSKKILGQFTDNLQAKLEAGEAPAAPVPPAEPQAVAGETVSANAEAANARVADEPSTDAPTEVPKVRKIDSPEAEAVDVLAVSGDAMTKRLAPVAGVALLGFILYLLRRRS